MRWMIFLVVLFWAAPLRAEPVNIITAVDVSLSVTSAGENLEYQGLALGVADDGFLALVEQAGGASLAVFTWSSNAVFGTALPWTVIRSPGDADAVAAILMAAPRMPRNEYGQRYTGQDSQGGMTNTSAALDYALTLALSAPFRGARTIINIMTDSRPTEGPAPLAQRAAAEARGITVNAVVFSPQDAEVPAWFRSNVITGPGAFVVTISSPTHLPEVLRRKFLQDMISALAAGRG